MEDSLEDFIRMVRNTNNVKNSENLENYCSDKTYLALQIKRDCEGRAQRIVEFLIEGKIKQDIFLNCLRLISPSHYDDVVEERAISKLCGYALCGKKIPDMPKKQFYISSKENKVYDITERKSYCSNYCYKASTHIKEQIDTSPLWLRREENFPKFTLLEKTTKVVPGVVVDQGITKPVEDSTFASVVKFTQLSLNDLSAMEIKKKPTFSKKLKNNSKVSCSMETISEKEELDDSLTTNKISISKENVSPLAGINKLTVGERKELNSTVNENKKAIENAYKPTALNKLIVTEKKADDQTLTKGLQTQIKTVIKDSSNSLEYIKKCVQEWITLETFIFLYGEAEVQKTLKDNKLEEWWEKIKLNETKLNQKIKYARLCKRLKLEQVADERFDKSVIGRELSPLPDYKELKEENKNLKVKVKAFYGSMVQTTQENTDSQEDVAILPLVENSSQNVTRRKVFLNSIEKTIQTVSQILDLSLHDVLIDFQSLVKTFKFQSHNVIFKLDTRNILALVLINLLSVRDISLKNKLEEKSSVLKLMLAPFPKGDDFLADTCKVVCDANIFLRNFILDENL